jgi:hypothetical protein
MSGTQECQELKNIRYKTMLLSGANASIVPTSNVDSSCVEMILEQERMLNKKEPWSKLDKTIKIKKLHEFVDRLSKEKSLSPAETKSLKKYLTTSLDKNRLQRVRDVAYDKSTGKVKTIPALHFNSTTRKFTLKRSDRRVSTLKSLGAAKTRKKVEKIDTNIKD